MANEVKDRWYKESAGITIGDFLDQFEGYRLVKDEPAAKPAEPEPWAELLDVCGSRYLLGQDRIEVEESRWKEQERRVKKLIDAAIYDEIWAEALIDAAIKAERERLALSIEQAIKMQAHCLHSSVYAAFFEIKEQLKEAANEK